MSNQYEQLKEHTIVVADTGDVDAIERLKPQDATTNPSLIYKAATMPRYAKLIDDAVEYGKGDLAVVMVSCSTLFLYCTRAPRVVSQHVYKLDARSRSSLVLFSNPIISLLFFVLPSFYNIFILIILRIKLQLILVQKLPRLYRDMLVQKLMRDCRLIPMPP